MTTLLTLVLVGLLVVLVVGIAASKWSAAQLEADATRARGKLAASWGALLDRSDVLILDTETTGLGQHSELVEIALVDTRGETRFDRPIMPLGRIPRQASDIHGLTRARLKELAAKPWPEVDRELEPIVRTARTLLIWNASFDVRLMEQTARKHAEKNPGQRAASGRPGARATARCVMKDYAALYGRPTIGLHEAARLEGVATVEPRHRALSDVLTVLATMRSVVQRADRLPLGWTPPTRAPRASAGGGWRDDPATQKQISFARSLLEQGGRDDEYDVEELEAMSKGEVSDLIEELKEDLGA